MIELTLKVSFTFKQLEKLGRVILLLIVTLLT
jgi:hypothetical protein